MRMADEGVWRQEAESLVRDNDRAMAERIDGLPLRSSP
jgi:hypothetical protein